MSVSELHNIQPHHGSSIDGGNAKTQKYIVMFFRYDKLTDMFFF